MRSNIKVLALDIETNRQRLQWAIDANDEFLQKRLLKLLVSLQASYYDATKNNLSPLTAEGCVLVFSDEFPEGARLTLVQYRELSRTMSSADRDTHVCIPIDPGMESAVEQAIVLNFQEIQSKKPA